MLIACVLVLVAYAAFLVGVRMGRSYGETGARLRGRVVEDQLRGLLQSMVIRNETLVTVLRQYAPELFDPRRFDETDEVKPKTH